jgi:hypothetical protein
MRPARSRASSSPTKAPARGRVIKPATRLARWIAKHRADLSPDHLRLAEAALFSLRTFEFNRNRSPEERAALKRISTPDLIAFERAFGCQQLANTKE